jgi:hypothetical protein
VKHPSTSLQRSAAFDGVYELKALVLNITAHGHELKSPVDGHAPTRQRVVRRADL